MIEIRNLSKSFPVASGTFHALRDISLNIADGDIFGIIGMSGAGKSTLVRCINMLERPTSGQVIVNGNDMGALSAARLRQARRDITMIFQQFNLLMQRTCLQNICFPLEISGVPRAEARKKATELLELVGLPEKASSYPAQLSGGQQQRIAIARALATSPKVLLCDEATSALDPNTTHQILQLIRDINAKLGITVVVITHQMSVVEEICNHVAILDHGTVAETGSVDQVFAAPKSDAGRRLVLPARVDMAVSKPDTQRLVRIVFKDAATASQPLVATLAAQRGIYASVLAADLQNIKGDTYGSMIISIPGGQFEPAMSFLKSDPRITAEEVSAHV